MARLIDVAKRSEVSITTASRVLNEAKHSEKVSDEVAARVRQAARELGYIGGYLRKTLRTGRAQALGVALEVNAPDASDAPPTSSLLRPFFARCVAGVEQVTHAAGYNLSIVVPSQDERAMVRGVSQVRELRLDGLVLLPGGTKAINTQVLREAPSLPICAVMPSVDTELPAVLTEPEVMMAMIVDHLATLGHRRLLYFGPEVPTTRARTENRHALLGDAAAAVGVEVEACFYRHRPMPHEHTEWALVDEQATALESHLAGRSTSATAVVAFNDVAAVSACRVLERRGLRVPRDVSVVGIDNLEPALMRPTLTSLDVRLVDQGLRAGRLVLDMIEGGEPAITRLRGHREAIRPHLHVRESTGPAPTEIPSRP